MFGLYTIIFLIAVFLLLAWFACQIKLKRKQIYVLSLILISILTLIETFRDGNINPDYYLYLQYIFYPISYAGEAEYSFFSIATFSRTIGGGPLLVFFIYAILGISVKQYAINVYSKNILYSICVWLSFFYILHDLIQIRAAVSGSLLLLMIPYVYNKEYTKSIIIWIIAILFHNSALIFGILYLLRRNTITPWKWLIIYMLVFIINFINYPIFSSIFKIISILPVSIADRIGRSNPELLNDLPRMTMYSRYILIPTLFCFGAFFFKNHLISIYPYSILCLKICLLGIFAFGIGLPIVSERVYELLSVPYIYLVPTSLYWFKKDSLLKGKIITTTFCLFMAWNLLFKQELFSINV